MTLPFVSPATKGPTPTPATDSQAEKYMIVWWLNDVPYYAFFKDAEQADSAARQRNALFISFFSDEPVVLDYKYRDTDGNPRPGVRRDLLRTFTGSGTMRLPA